jgi:hypothetical protein
VNSAKVEVQYLNISGKYKGTGFMGELEEPPKQLM